jgi:hypothetical protein
MKAKVKETNCYGLKAANWNKNIWIKQVRDGTHNELLAAKSKLKGHTVA